MQEYRVIHKNAQLGKGVEVGPFTSIAEDVEIGNGTWIGSNVTILDGVRIGDNCKIFPGSVIGAIPQDKKFENEDSILLIGNNVVVREFCTLNRATQANYATKIGNDSLLMAYTHIAHDCTIGDHCILANSVNLAGHVEIGNYAILGGLVAVHQFVKIGKYAMIGGGSLVRKDVPPFIKAAREPLSYIGVNSIGLKRRGYSIKRINHIQDIYRILFVKGFNTNQAMQLIEATIHESQDRSTILEFVKLADRGILRGFRTIK